MGPLPREIKRMGYWAFDWKNVKTEFYIDTILSANPDLVVGRYLVNTAYDSGRYRPTDEELRNGWKAVGALAHSPKISSIRQVPMHCCAPYDEWWVFENAAEIEEMAAFCNLLGFSPIDFGWVEKLEEFWEQVQRFRPLHVLGDGGFPFLVTREIIARDRARATQPTPNKSQ